MDSAPATRCLQSVLAIAIAALGALIMLPAATAHAEDESVGIAIAPVDSKGRDNGRSRFTYQVDPGQEIKDYVRVSNVGTSKLKVTVFATDAYNADNGDFALLDTVEEPTGAGSWVSFSGKPTLTLTLGRGKSTTIPFTVTVPADATPGDHPAGILASATTAGDLTVERRIANRMYVRVSGDLQPSLTVSSISGVHHGGLNPADGSAAVTATITNNGNVALEGVVTLSATTWFGIGVGSTAREELSELLPGNTRTVSFELDGVPQVGYATVTMLLQSAISGDAPDPGPLPVVEREVFVLAIPWAVAAALLLSVGGSLVLRWRRARDDRRAAEWIAYTEAEAARKVREGEDAERVAVGQGGVVVPGHPSEGAEPGEVPGDTR